jgi:tRNA G46 methylase TrmB
MKVGGCLYVATDVPDYAESIFSMAAAQGLQASASPVAGAIATGFARRFIAEGRPVYSKTFTKRAEETAAPDRPDIHNLNDHRGVLALAAFRQ